MELTLSTQYYQPTDDYTLVNEKEHYLWQTKHFLHCSSIANWQFYQAELSKLLPEDCYRDFTGTVQLWYICNQWQVFKDTVDKVYCDLRNQDIPTNGASINSLLLQIRDKNSETPYLRGKSALCIYVRIDYDEQNNCKLELENGEKIELESGTLIITSGYRRHRLTGAGHILNFQLSLPSLSRNDALHPTVYRQDNVSDEVAFAAATSLPLDIALPSTTQIQEKLDWLQRRANRRYRHHHSPVVKRFLIDNVDPAQATEKALEQISKHGCNSNVHANNQNIMIEGISVLNDEQCAILRNHICNHITSVVPDSVDDLPEYQVNINSEQLTELLDENTTNKLLNLPKYLHQQTKLRTGHEKLQLNMFLRMYSPTTRSYIAFHSDICRYTSVIALNNQDDFHGGRFVMLADNQLQFIPWQTGKALLHSGNLIHGVSRLTKGVRYSLVLFYNTVD